MTVDRLIAIKWPYLYISLTKRRTTIVTIAEWILSIIFTFFIVGFKAGLAFRSTTNISTTALVICVLSFSNIIIYRIALKQNREARKTFVMRVNVHVDDETSKKITHEDKILLRNHRNEFRSAVICLSMVLSFVLCYMPALIRYVMLLFESEHSSKIVGSTLAIVRYFNSILDSIIYILSKRDVKRRICRIFRKKDIQNI